MVRVEPGFNLDPGRYRLSKFPVGHTDDLYGHNRRVGVQEFLDFPRVNVFTSVNDYVFGAARNLEIPARVEDGQIAGMQPTILFDCSFGRLDVLVITLHDMVSARTQ